MSTSPADVETPAISAVVNEIERLKDQYYTESKRLKLAYLTSVTDARTVYGTSAIADALDVSRHRIYQIERERTELERELDDQ